MKSLLFAKIKRKNNVRGFTFMVYDYVMKVFTVQLKYVRKRRKDNGELIVGYFFLNVIFLCFSI